MSVSDTARAFFNAPAFKFVVVLFLILALSIPLIFVYVLFAEREQRAREATSSISQSWGRSQILSGPYLVVPVETAREERVGNTTRTINVTTLQIFRPERLDVEANLETEVRRRGIFSVPVYRSKLAFDGAFAALDDKAKSGSGRWLWNDAAMVLIVSDVRGIKATASAELGPLGRRQFRAGSGAAGHGGGIGAIHIPVTEAEATAGFAYQFELALNGSQGMQFSPAGGDTKIAVKSDWPHPSFDGAFLPDNRTITDASFDATWTIPRLARGTSQMERVPALASLRAPSAFGVKLFQPVRFYSLAQRALKYAVGFIGVVFFAVFIMEVQARRRVHWIQYILVGLALVIFYVLLIGTAEHIGFDAGYAIASIATAALIGIYFGTVVNSRLRGFALFSLIAAIYGLLYLLLRIEDYALLVGSIAAFLTIATVMFVTRNIDWSRGIEAGEAPAPATS